MYVDVLFVLNLSMNILLLYLTEKMCRCGLRMVRCFLAGCLGALAGTCLPLVALPVWFEMLMALIVSSLMVFISFGNCDSLPLFLRTCGILWGATVISGGTMIFLSERIATEPNRAGLFMVLVIGSGISAVLWRVICWKKQRASIRVNVMLDGKMCEFQALCDSGNLAKEPISGLPIVILSASAAQQLFPKMILENLVSGETKRMLDLPEALRPRSRVVTLSTTTGQQTVCGILPDHILLSEGNSSREVKAFLVIRAVGKAGFGGCAGIVPASLVMGA